MTILIVEINPNKVLIDEDIFPDKHKEEFIYEHLRHYCSKFYPIPTIEVKVYTDSVFVIRGHLYLKIAKEFGHSQIRAIINKSSSNDSIIQLLQNPSVIELNWQSLIQEDEPICYVWLVFFFAHPLNQEEKYIFEEQVLGFFSKINLPGWAEISNDRIKDMKYVCSGIGVEFQAYLPVDDERWYASSRAALVNFHFKYVPIISFQGRKFQPEYN